MIQRITFRLLLVVSCCFATSGLIAAGKDGADWSAGIAAIDITPETPMWMGGYGGRNKPSQGKEHDLHAKALVVQDAKGNRLAILTMDLVKIPRSLRDEVAASIHREHGIRAEALMMNCSHTHSGPLVLANRRTSIYQIDNEQAAIAKTYYQGLKIKLVDVVGQAIKQMAPAKLSYSHARAGFAMNRRMPTENGYQNQPNPDGVVDHDVPVLKVEEPDGKLRAILFGYACHATTLGVYKFCGDYPGFAQEYLERDNPGVIAMFVAGCGGDQNPYPRHGDRALEYCRQHGQTLATAVEAALVAKSKPIRSKLAVEMKEVSLAFAAPPSHDALQKLLESGNRYQRHHAGLLLEELSRNGKIRDSYPYPIQVIQFGDQLTLIALAGETVVDYSLRLKRELANTTNAVWVAGYSNDVFSYVPSQRVLQEGGYEADRAISMGPLPGPFEPSVEKRIVDRVHQLVSKVRAEVDRESANDTKPLLRVVDLDMQEQQTLTLCDGSKATVKLVGLKETRDPIRGAIRRADVSLLVNGKSITIQTGMYNLPQTIGDVQVDCSVTQGYNTNGTPEFWGLDKAVRIRLWPAGSPWIEPGSMVYPVRQRWFASFTAFDNLPVDGGTKILPKIYYHSGMDIGACEYKTEIVAAADALVIASGDDALDEYKDLQPVLERYDRVYLRDARGWIYRHSHLATIDEDIKPGRVIKAGTRLGTVGKEGTSGGWTHLHFEIKAIQPSGKWGVQAGYAFLLQSYREQYNPAIIANARQTQLIRAGENAILDGSRSWSRDGSVVKHEWQFDDGTVVNGAVVKRQYSTPGSYHEILKVTDEDGNIDYDFQRIKVIDPEHPGQYGPRLHATYWPTLGISAGDSVTFKVRSFQIPSDDESSEEWDFGDGSPRVKVQSDGNRVALAKDGYAVTQHSFAKPGHYIVTVRRPSKNGHPNLAHLHVHVGK